MGITIQEGNYEKLGVHIEKNGMVVFTFQGEKEDSCAILFYGKDNQVKYRVEVPKEYCMGSVRSIGIMGLSPKELIYNYEMNGQVVTDPYATRIIGREKWNDISRESKDYAICGGYEEDGFDWKDDHQPELPRWQMFMYKLHVRGFSMDAGIRGKTRGTFQAIIERIPYLKSIGVTTIEFMPVYEFEEVVLPPKTVIPEYLNWESKEGDLITKEQKRTPLRVNYWGYGPGNYFAVKASYASNHDAATEWKTLIRELHANGMECVMEMYFDEQMNQNIILDALRFWVREYHVDGFHLLGTSIPVTAVAQDMFLSRTKIFGEGFEPFLLEEKKTCPHLFVYNDEYLYPIRKMLNHAGGDMEAFVCQQRKQHPIQGFVNYIAGNNGFTLYDLFSYQEKHNEANGESNCDGNQWNFSSNYGVEGNTTKRYVCESRERQLRNAIAILLLSQGVPLLLAGDEFGNSQKGNNNAYCQDNAIGWLNWKMASKYDWLQDFTGKMMAFRNAHPMISMDEPMQMNDYGRKGFPDLSYHGENAWISTFYLDRQSVGMMYCGAYAPKLERVKEKEPAKGKERNGDFVYVGYNFHNGLATLALPRLPEKKHWYLVMDTSLGRNAFLEKEVKQKETQISLSEQSVVILLGK